MKTDNQIQMDVIDELAWEPFLNESQIGVAVKEGVVTLSGIVDTYSKKLSAEKAARRVSGVKAIAEDIQVGLSPAYRKTDTEIAEAVITNLKWHSAVKEDKIKIKVEDGIVTLSGEVEWDYQRSSAKTAIGSLSGVKSVINLITLKPGLSPADVQLKINAAFQRSATVDSSKVKAEVSGHKVTLRGTVRSFAEKADAEKAAWAAPGVWEVESRLEIDIPEYAI